MLAEKGSEGRQETRQARAGEYRVRCRRYLIASAVRVWDAKYTGSIPSKENP